MSIHPEKITPMSGIINEKYEKIKKIEIIFQKPIDKSAFLWYYILVAKKAYNFIPTEKSRSWSSAHDWKSCNRQKRFESSNLSFSANEATRKGGFFRWRSEIRTENRVAVRDGEKSTAAGGGKREIFRVAATWLLLTELRRARKSESPSCNSANGLPCENLSFSANEATQKGGFFRWRSEI